MYYCMYTVCLACMYVSVYIARTYNYFAFLCNICCFVLALCAVVRTMAHMQNTCKTFGVRLTFGQFALAYAAPFACTLYTLLRVLT